MRHRHLLAPLDLGFLQLRNRMVMGAMHTRLETLDRPTERLAAFYGERAQGEAALILTGGFAPNADGRMEADAPALTSPQQLDDHRAITDAVHAQGGHIALQILHAGRYAKHAQCVAPSALRAPINRHTPRALETQEVRATIEDFAHTAQLAQQAGYDGVEIMGSEGYLITQFVCACTNTRNDEFGGDFEARIRLPLEIVKAVRSRVGAHFLLIYRISAADLVEGGLCADEVAELARRLEQAGVHMLNTGIGWHESAVPTIAAAVPRAAWREAIANLKRAVRIPVIASNRINTPEVAEALLAEGVADLVSMARPLLADPDFARKVREGTPEQIAPCVACNQACLDHIFTQRSATCLVNPRAGHELDWPARAAGRRRSIAVVGAGPAGLSFAIQAAQRGHAIRLYEAQNRLGGQLLMAETIPGKGEFGELLRYFRTQIAALPIDVHLGHPVDLEMLCDAGHDSIVIATGVRPRQPAIPGIGHPKVMSYLDVLARGMPVGGRVAILGAGGIGFDTAAFLLGADASTLSPARFFETWGVDPTLRSTGGLCAPAAPPAPAREIHVLQRSAGKPGARLGKTTGWILKAALQRAGVRFVTGAQYTRIDDAGLHYEADGQAHVLEVDHVIVCAGQEPERTLHEQLTARGLSSHVLGGAESAAELDAQRAIAQATALALSL